MCVIDEGSRPWRREEGLKRMAWLDHRRNAMSIRTESCNSVVVVFEFDAVPVYRRSLRQLVSHGNANRLSPNENNRRSDDRIRRSFIGLVPQEISVSSQRTGALVSAAGHREF